MKRFVFAGLFLVLGFIILGAATSYLMNEPDQPAKPPHPAANADESKRHGGQGGTQQVNSPSLPSQNQQGQFGMPGRMGSGQGGGASGTSGGLSGNLTQVPNSVVPLTVPAATIRPNPNAGDVPHVPPMQQTDESSSHASAGKSK
jgi:hypothetical protein